MNFWWNPENIARKRVFLQRRAAILCALHDFFRAQGFLAVETPALQVSPGLEPHLFAFKTLWEGPGGQQREFYLHTSPEFSMKKLLVGGFEKIYQVSHVYRNRESSSTHHPEFSMLEWYRRGSDYVQIMNDTELLLQACAVSAKQAGASGLCSWQGVSSDPSLPFERLSVADAFLRYTGVDILRLLEDRDGFGRAATELGITVAKDDRWDDIFFRIFLEKIESKLGVGQPTILFDYPISMAALARPKPGMSHLAERFEVYVCGLELANAFSELTNAKQQKSRFEADMDLKESLYKIRYPIDPGFIAALELGLPECAGIALGVDRLMMLLTGAPDIESVLWAPVEIGND
jgi:lysyl-tRNA synthetase class 2